MHVWFEIEVQYFQTKITFIETTIHIICIYDLYYSHFFIINL